MHQSDPEMNIFFRVEFHSLIGFIFMGRGIIVNRYLKRAIVSDMGMNYNELMTFLQGGGGKINKAMFDQIVAMISPVDWEREIISSAWDRGFIEIRKSVLDILKDPSIVRLSRSESDGVEMLVINLVATLKNSLAFSEILIAVQERMSVGDFELSTATKITVATIRDYRNGVSAPKKCSAEKLAKALDLPGELLGRFLHVAQQDLNALAGRKELPSPRPLTDYAVMEKVKIPIPTAQPKPALSPPAENNGNGGNPVPVDTQTLAMSVRSLRETLGLSQKNFASTIGRSEWLIESLEKGEASPNKTLISLFKKTYGVDYSSFL